MLCLLLQFAREKKLSRMSDALIPMCYAFFCPGVIWDLTPTDVGWATGARTKAREDVHLLTMVRIILAHCASYGHFHFFTFTFKSEGGCPPAHYGENYTCTLCSVHPMVTFLFSLLLFFHFYFCHIQFKFLSILYRNWLIFCATALYWLRNNENVQNREMKSESGFSLAMASQLFKSCYNSYIF